MLPYLANYRHSPNGKRKWNIGFIQLINALLNYADVYHPDLSTLDISWINYNSLEHLFKQSREEFGDGKMLNFYELGLAFKNTICSKITSSIFNANLMLIVRNEDNEEKLNNDEEEIVPLTSIDQMHLRYNLMLCLQQLQDCESNERSQNILD